jgi:Amidase
LGGTDGQSQTEGVLTRSVRDTAHYLAAAERYHTHPELEPVGLVEGAAAERLRIGLIAHDVFGRPVHPETDAVLRSAAAALASRGHQLLEMPLGMTPQLVEDFKLYWALTAVVMCALMTASYGVGFHRERLDPFTRGLARLFWRNATGLIPAIRRLRRGTQLYDAHFANVDVLLTPVLAHPAPKIGEHAPDQPFETLLAKLIDYVAFTPINNIGGGPAIALPHGMMARGLPGSIQLSAPRGGERTLLQLAYELETTNPFPQITTASCRTTQLRLRGTATCVGAGVLRGFDRAWPRVDGRRPPRSSRPLLRFVAGACRARGPRFGLPRPPRNSRVTGSRMARMAALAGYTGLFHRAKALLSRTISGGESPTIIHGSSQFAQEHRTLRILGRARCARDPETHQSERLRSPSLLPERHCFLPSRLTEILGH